MQFYYRLHTVSKVHRLLCMFIAILIAGSAACGFPQSAPASCGIQECCCCSSHQKPTKKKEQDSCGCRIEKPSPAAVANDIFLPFTPAIHLVTMADYGLAIFSIESKTSKCTHSAWTAPPPLRRLHQQICVYVI